MQVKGPVAYCTADARSVELFMIYLESPPAI